MNTTRQDQATITPVSAPSPTGGSAATTPPIITSTTDTSSARTKLNLETSDQTLVAGILANLSDVETFVLPSGTFAREDLVGAIHDRIAAAEATKSSKNTWHASVQTERQAEADIRPIRKGMQQYVASRYGADSLKMAEFGFTPVKARKTTVRTKAGALDKAAATRLARHTMGKKEKLAIHGTPAATTAGSSTAAVTTPAVTTPAVASTPAATPASTSIAK